MQSVVRELWPDPQRGAAQRCSAAAASTSSGSAAASVSSRGHSAGDGSGNNRGTGSGSDSARDPAAAPGAAADWPAARGLFKVVMGDVGGGGSSNSRGVAGDGSAAHGGARPGQLLEPSPCPLSPTRPRSMRSPSRSKAGGNLTALAATLSGLGVQLDRPQPDALKPSVADIAAGINRTVNALARIAGQLGDAHPRGPPSAPGSPGAAASASGPSSPTRRRAPSGDPWPQPQPRRASQQQPDVGAPLDRVPRRSPGDPLKGAATHEQLQQLRAELDRLNSTVLRARQSGGPAALAASGGRQPAAGVVSHADAATTPAPGSEGHSIIAGEQASLPAVAQGLSPARQCHQMVHEATEQLRVLQAENRELRTHLGEAEQSVSDLRRQLINLQLAIDRTGGTDAGALLLQNQKLQRTLHAKEAAAAAALAAAAAQGPAASDERVAELTLRLKEAKAQLRARDTALLASEARIRELRWLEEKEKERAAAEATAVAAGPADAGEGDGSSAAEAAAAVAALQRERQRVASLEAALEGYRSELSAREGEVRALRSQVLLLKQQAPQAPAAPVGVPALEDALEQLARRAEEAAALRADVRRAEAERAAALAEQAAAFGAKLEVQQRALDDAQAELRAREGEASELRERLQQAAAEQQQLQAELDAATASGMEPAEHATTSAVAVKTTTDAAAAAAAATEGDVASEWTDLRRLVNDRTEEIDRLRGFLAQLYDTARCGAPSAAPSPRVSNAGGSGSGELAVRVQQGVQQLVARLGEQQAEVARLREAARLEWMQRRFPGQPGVDSSTGRISSGDGAEDLPGTTAVAGGHEDEVAAGALAAARTRVDALERQVAELEEANAACMSELEQAAARLAASEQQLLAMVALQRAHEDLRARAAELQAQAEAASANAESEAALRAKAETAAAEAAADADVLRARLAEAEAAVGAALDARRAAKAAAAEAAQRAAEAEALLNPEVEQGAVVALKERCGELEQQLSRLRAQLADADTQRSRLHAANAALQERLSSVLQAESGTPGGSRRASASGGGDVRALQGRCQELEQVVTALEKQLLEQQQHQQGPGAHELDAYVGGDQPVSLSRQGSQQAAWLRQLSARSAPGAAEVEVEVTLPGGAPTAAALRRRCEQLAGQVSALQQQAEARAAQLKRAEDRAREAEAAARAAGTLRTQVIALRRERDALAAELEQRSSELQQWQVHAQALEEDLDQLRSEAAEAEAAGGGGAAAEAEARAREAGERLVAKQAALEAAQAELQGARDTIAYLQDAISSNAQDYQALLARHQQAEAGLARSQEAAADMRARLEAITGPAGPQARLRQLEAQLAQMQRKLEAADAAARDAQSQRAAAASDAAARGEEVIALEGQLAVVTEELEATRGALEAMQQRTPRMSSVATPPAATTPRTPAGGGGGGGGSTLLERSAAAVAGGATAAVASPMAGRGGASGRRRQSGAV